jgi:hypothetical protein
MIGKARLRGLFLFLSIFASELASPASFYIRLATFFNRRFLLHNRSPKTKPQRLV